MEPDLDRLLDYEAGGGLFPQFGKEWRTVLEAAQSARDLIVRKERTRIALRCESEISFCTLFLAFSRSRVDLFLYNPNWGEAENEQAELSVSPQWILGDCSGSGFGIEKRESVSRADYASGDGLRVMIPTGGTSGKVRFAMHDWGTLSASAHGFQMYFEKNTVSSLCLLPLYHVSGFMQLIRSMLTLGKVVFGKADTMDETHELLIETCQELPFLSLVSTQLERLLRDEANVSRLSQYEAIFVGGGPVSVGLLETCREHQLPIAPTYGMTETAAQVATLKPREFLQGVNGQGRQLPHVRIGIVDEEGNVLAANEEGRIKIYSTAVCHGYWGDEEDDSKSLITADLGRLDAAGRLTVLGRVDRVAISGGEKVNLREIEIAFEETGLLSDVSAFGVEDKEWGTRIGLAYVPKDNAVSEEVLKDFVKERLASYKIPKQWIRMDVLPRNEAGKLKVEDLLAKG